MNRGGGSLARRKSGLMVWDLGVRLFHWALVISFALAAYTGFLGPRNWLNLHLIAGIAAGALVIFRLVWGWLGSRYARFHSFPLSPAAMKAHLAAIIAEYRQAEQRHPGSQRLGAPPRHHPEAGHNPLGAAMVYALLLAIALTVLTGAVALGGVVKQGPLAFLVSFDLGLLIRDLHQVLAIALLCMVGAHLAGVIFESRREKINLAAAMITGRKPIPGAATPEPHQAARPGMAAIVLLVLAAAIVPATIALARLPGRGVPPATLDPIYAKECGACHFAYPPSLAPAAVWISMMEGLDRHFGENADLDATTAAHIRDYLTANAAEKWDTRPAHLFRQRDPADPLRITATPFWQRLHRQLPEALFKLPAVGAKGACNACHRDAGTGRFDPQSILVPPILVPTEARP
ncbi:MAG TPA: cytochrome b/b6 domain-containing protein [Dongiaceae bacterium]|nr:cytochrome b/b6 domain-containing protein [Dongiaceae bacterium]